MSAPRLITALVVPTGDEPAYLRKIEPTLDVLNRLVGGGIEGLGITGDSTTYLHQDGKWEGLPFNDNANEIVNLADPGLDPDDFLVGQVVVVGHYSPAGVKDGSDYDVPESVLALCARRCHGDGPYVRTAHHLTTRMRTR